MKLFKQTIENMKMNDRIEFFGDFESAQNYYTQINENIYL